MDMSLEQYLKELNDAIKAMMELKKETSQAIKNVIYDNYWQKQSAFNSKVASEAGQHSRYERL